MSNYARKNSDGSLADSATSSGETQTSGEQTIITGTDGNDVLTGTSGDDLITGGRGNDVAKMGAGDDTFVWNPGDGSDTVEGQSGTDTLLFNGSNVNENISISANGSRATLFRDVGNVTMDLNSIEHIQLNALGGADTVTVNDLSGTGVKQVAIDLALTSRQRRGRRSGGHRDRQWHRGTTNTIKIATNGGSVVRFPACRRPSRSPAPTPPTTRSSSTD